MTPDQPVRVLLVDDDNTITLLCRMLLERAGGHIVAEEDDAFRALQTAKNFSPDIIFVDRCLPGKTGAQLVEEFQAEPTLKDVPIVYLTGGLCREETSTGYFGGLPILPKPFNPDDLPKMIQSLTAARSLKEAA